jgi:undecaprenyl-diphosphatase
MRPEMSIEDTTVLGIIRGLTEFLPLSSSGHLVIFQRLIGLRGPEAPLDIALHVGTLLAILTLFRADVMIMIIESMRFVRTVLRKGKPIGQM